MRTPERSGNISPPEGNTVGGRGREKRDDTGGDPTNTFRGFPLCSALYTESDPHPIPSLTTPSPPRARQQVLRLSFDSVENAHQCTTHLAPF